MTRTHTIIDSPIDPITLVAQDGRLCGLYMSVHKHQPDVSTFGERDARVFGQVIEELQQYFAGDRTQFDIEPAAAGNEFQRLVWNGLCDIPYGETWSYKQLAEHIGKPGAARAVGTINGQNPVSIIVPCHRVIGANGKLVGYGGGLERKEFLLNLEKGAPEPAVEELPLFG
jgi:methylated-DNA-[protein]-cysteine S-methyltransferase